MTKTKLNTAELLKDVSSDFKGEAKLYKLSEPVKYTGGYGDERKKRQTKFVVVSSISAAPDHGGSETFIFPADATGKVQDWGELTGSDRGNVTHKHVLSSLGFNL